MQVLPVVRVAVIALILMKPEPHHLGNQDNAANIDIQDSGLTAVLSDNTWRRTNTRYDITANTVIEFEFQSTSQGEIHGIGFDSDEQLSAAQIFQL